MNLQSTWQNVVQTAKDIRTELRERDELVQCISEGNLPEHGGRLTVRYLGRKRFADDFLMFFDRDAIDAAVNQNTSEPKQIFRFLRERRQAQSCPENADILLIDSMWESPKEKTVYLAPHINAILPIQPTIDAQVALIRSKGHRRKIQSALKRGFTWRATRSRMDFNLFYDRMYAPFVHERFRYDAFQVPKEEMYAQFLRRGLLLFIEEQDLGPVSGAFLYFSRRAPDTVFYWKYGILDSKELSPNVFGERNAMTEAMVLQYAVEQGYKKIDFGLTHALPLDGIFMHKKRVGNDFMKTPNAPQFRIMFNPASKVRFLSRFPMIVIIDGGLHAYLGFEGELTPKRVEKLKDDIQSCTFQSLRSVQVFTNVASSAAPVLQDALQTLNNELGCPLVITPWPAP